MIVKTVYHAFFVLIWLAFAGAARAVISYNPQDWPAYTLKFSKEGTLKDVYDSGLRPWLPPGFERSYLGFKHARITVQTHEGNILPEVPVEYSEIYCTRDGRLHSIMLKTPGFAFPKARELILPWLDNIGKTESELDKFLSIVKANPIGYQDRDFGKAPDGFNGVWLDELKVKYLARLINNKNPNQPLRFVFSITWFNLRSERDRNDVHLEPIKPPAGYGNESLKPPVKWGPDSELDKARALDLDTGESPEAVAEQRRNGERPPLKPGDPPLGRPDPNMLVMVSPPASGGGTLPWLLPAMILAGVVILGLAVRALRADKEG